VKKILIIDSCNDCPYFDNSYYDYARICDKLHKVNKSNIFEILEECPLKDAEQDDEVS
jgi:hypothetical protein